MGCSRHLHRFLLICLAAILFGRPALGAEIGLPDKLAFLALLEQGEFETLDRRLSAYQEAFEEDCIPDTLVDYAFSTFANSDPALEPRLANWIHQMPDSRPGRPGGYDAGKKFKGYAASAMLLVRRLARAP